MCKDDKFINYDRDTKLVIFGCYASLCLCIQNLRRFEGVIIIEYDYVN